MESAGDNPFPPTRWSLVLTASDPSARAARDELCRLYWSPLYAFARRHGLTPEDAEDVTQDFFLQFAGGERLTLDDLAPAGGRLRTYFLKVFQRLLIDTHRRKNRIKRGGSVIHVSIEEAEAWLDAGARNADPLALYDRCWALAILDASVASMGREYAAAGRKSHFELLRPFLGVEQTAEPSYENIAAALAANPVSARQTVHRFRDRFRATLRRHVAATLDEPNETSVDTELRALLAALA